jgi:hypothetical protein
VCEFHEFLIPFLVKDTSSVNCHLIVEGVLLPSGIYSYAEQGPLVQDVEHFDHDGVNIPHVEFATPAYTAPTRETVLQVDSFGLL